jgi:hypothetical protein
MNNVTTVPFEGYMIPGLHFETCSIWVLHWENNPTPFKKMVEVWILWYDGRRTETGMYYHNKPTRIVPLLIEKAELNGIRLSPIAKPDYTFSLGDGKPSDEPIINYCTHLLEA